MALRDQARRLPRQLHRHNGIARTFTRNGLDWSRQFAPICQALAELPATSAILDGEVVVLDEHGVPDFGAVRGAIASAQDKLRYYAFDLLHLDGFDLRGCGLADRRCVLAQLIASKPAERILISETVEGEGAVLSWHACDMGLAHRRAVSQRPVGKLAQSEVH